MSYEHLFNQLNSQKAISETVWLIYAETVRNMSFTSSDMKDYKKYGKIISFNEEMRLINKQIASDDGFYSSNLNIVMPKDHNSIQFFNKFKQKNTLNKIELVQIFITSNGSFFKQHSITYSKSLIEFYETGLNEVHLKINYNDRSEVYTSYSNNVKNGQIVSM